MIARATTRRPILLLFVVSAAHCLYAQDSGRPQARKLDEIRPGMYGGDIDLRLIRFSEEVGKEGPGAKVYLVGYHGRRGRLPKVFSPVSVRTWLTEAGGLAGDRIVTREGGRRAFPALELWLVPEGAPPPAPAAPPGRREPR
jgi:hypothetical protein